jgi:hypothetical protein
MSNPKLMLANTRFENQNEHGGNENARGRFPARAATVSDDVNVRLICPTCQTAIFESFEGGFAHFDVTSAELRRVKTGRCVSRSGRRFLRGCRYAPDLPDVSNSFQNSRDEVDEATVDKRTRWCISDTGTFSAGLTLDQLTSNLCRIR